MRTCETLFEGSLCLATLIDASWPGAGRRVERLTKRGEAGCGVGVVGSEGCQAAAQPRLGMQCVMGV